MDSILFSSLIQVLAFALIPFIVHLVVARTYKRFFRSLGLYPAPSFAIKLGVVAGLLLATGDLLIFFYLPDAKTAYLAGDANAGMIRDLDDPVERITALLVIASLKTALAEELFFRGFIGRGLVRRIGFAYGNLIQALIFGVLAVILLLDLNGVSTPHLLYPFLLSTAAGYCAGYLNIFWGGGSTWPGYVMHATGDLLFFGFLTFGVH